MAKRMSCSEDPVPCTFQYRTAGYGESVRPFAVRSRPEVLARRNAPASTALRADERVIGAPGEIRTPDLMVRSRLRSTRTV